MVQARPPAPEADAHREFLLVVRQALLVIVRWVEQRYDLPTAPEKCPRCRWHLRH